MSVEAPNSHLPVEISLVLIITSYHSQANDPVKCLPRTLKAALRTRLRSPSWTGELPWVTLGLRTTPMFDLMFLSCWANLFITCCILQFSKPQLITIQLLKILSRRSALDSLSYVFVQKDAHRPLLCLPYHRPFKCLRDVPRPSMLRFADVTSPYLLTA